MEHKREEKSSEQKKHKRVVSKKSIKGYKSTEDCKRPIQRSKTKKR